MEVVQNKVNSTASRQVNEFKLFLFRLPAAFFFFYRNRKKLNYLITIKKNIMNLFTDKKADGFEGLFFYK